MSSGLIEYHRAYRAPRHPLSAVGKVARLLEYKKKYKKQCTRYTVQEQGRLEIPRVHNVSYSILWRYDVEYLVHVVENPVSLCSTVVVLMATNEMLDLGECLFDGVEVRRIRRQVLDANAESIGELEKLSAVVDPSVVKYQDAERAGIRATEG
jgi:hypothetical protein